MKCGFKIRIYPTDKQIELLLLYCKVSHEMWNMLVEKFQYNLPRVNSFGIVEYSPRELMDDYNKKFNNCIKIPQRIVLGVMKKYSNSVISFYKGITRPPKFHKYIPSKQSFYIASKSFSIKNSSIPFLVNLGLKSKLDVMSKRIFLDENYINKFNITDIIEPRFLLEDGKYFITGSYSVSDVKKIKSKNILGLDWGLKNFFTDSNSNIINYPSSILREYNRILKLQRLKDIKKKKSNNREKLKRKLHDAWKRLDNLKRDFIEKETTLLAKKYHISVEKLLGIELNHKYFYRFDLIQPRYRFVEKLRWKCEKYGSYFVEINPANTSKMCSNCKSIHSNFTRYQRVMKCDCGLILDRDVNAAINIRNRGVEILHEMGVCCTY